jgi:uncharacterized membrane protein
VFATVGHASADTLYGIVLLLHILAAIVGFGPTFVYPLYGAASKRRQGPDGEALLAETIHIAGITEFAIYAVPVFGILLVLLSDDALSFGDPWISAAFVLYFVAIAISRGLHVPNLKAMNALQKQLVAMGPPPAGATGPPPQVAELEERGRRAGMYGGMLHTLLLVILYLMVFKPGWP